ncbi:MAG: chromate transporter, partial [Caldimonas sp.]
PITIGLLVATGWVLAQPYLVGDTTHFLGAVAVLVVSVVVMTWTKLSPMWLVGLGAVAGGSGLV